MKTDTIGQPPPTMADRYPWILVALLWLVSFLNAADRSVIVAVMPAIRAEFALSDTQLALISTVFFWFYAVAALFTGRLGDGARRSRVVIWGLIFWSIATGIVPLSTGFAMLLALRAVVAVGESTYYPTATALIGDWHGAGMRSRALSFHQTAVFAGSGLGALLAGAIADRLGWRAPFLVFAIAGLIWAIVLWRTLRDAPIRHTAAERLAASNEPYRVVLAIKPALMLFAVFFLATGVASGVTDRRASTSPASSPCRLAACSPTRWPNAPRSAASSRWRSGWRWRQCCWRQWRGPRRPAWSARF
jgi:MFS family permease